MASNIVALELEVIFTGNESRARFSVCGGVVVIINHISLIFNPSVRVCISFYCWLGLIQLPLMVIVIGLIINVRKSNVLKLG